MASRFAQNAREVKLLKHCVGRLPGTGFYVANKPPEENR
jgi:hypothetical protein